MTLEEALISVWRQALVEKADAVELAGHEYPVRRTPKRGLVQVDFRFDRQNLRGLEQNPETKSRWAQLARAGKRVMQFLSAGRYIAVVVDGEATLYGSAKKSCGAKA
jgi:precorrin-2 methylase